MGIFDIKTHGGSGSGSNNSLPEIFNSPVEIIVEEASFTLETIFTPDGDEIQQYIFENVSLENGETYIFTVNGVDYVGTCAFIDSIIYWAYPNLKNPSFVFYSPPSNLIYFNNLSEENEYTISIKKPASNGAAIVVEDGEWVMEENRTLPKLDSDETISGTIFTASGNISSKTNNFFVISDENLEKDETYIFTIFCGYNNSTNGTSYKGVWSYSTDNTHEIYSFTDENFTVSYVDGELKFIAEPNGIYDNKYCTITIQKLLNKILVTKNDEWVLQNFPTIEESLKLNTTIVDNTFSTTSTSGSFTGNSPLTEGKKYKVYIDDAYQGILELNGVEYYSYDSEV